MLVEPGNGLAESLLLGVLVDLVGEIAAHGEPMGNTAVEIDLIRVTSFLQNHLGPVTLLGWENAVRLGRGNGERLLELCQLLFLDERRMRHEADVDAALAVADNVLRSTC